jgi:hypothetical protein
MGRARFSLAHAVIIALLASFWLSALLPYLSLNLGIVAWVQGL